MRKIITLVVALSSLAALPALAGWDEGVAAFTAKNFVQAAAEFKALVEQNPDGYRGHYMLGLSLEQLNRKEEALHHLRKAYDLNPNELGVKIALGRAYYRLRQYADTSELLGTLDPGSLPGAQQAGFYQMRANARLKVGDQAGALDDLSGLTRLRPDDAAAQSSYGRLAVAAGQLDAGIDALARASRLAPDDLEVKRDHARALVKKGRTSRDKTTKKDAYSKAAVVAAEIVAADPSHDHHLLKISAELGAGLYPEAVESGQAAVAMKNDDWLGHYYLGQAYASNGQFAEAEGPLETAKGLAASPDDAKLVWRQLGFAYEKQKKYAQAIEAYQTAGEAAAVTRVRANEETERSNQEVEKQNQQIEEMQKEAERLEKELKELEGGGG